jgi:3-isopropylmalate/(R)-2-methylmalate dehydratase small subunit
MTPTLREPIATLVSPYVAIPAVNIDTDQIIPARFLKTTERAGLGPRAFYDWRYTADGSPRPDFPLNTPDGKAARILVAGRNFGCGSSREHAVWALLDAGIRAVVSSEFADIFRGNALGNGLLPVQIDEEIVQELIQTASVPSSLTVDLESQTLTLADGRTVTFPVPPFAKTCLLRGIDELGFLIDAAPEIERHERERPPLSIAR